MFKDFDDQKNFELWAFGHNPYCYTAATLHSWNSHHGDIYWIRGSDVIEDSMEIMYEHYKEWLRGKEAMSGECEKCGEHCIDCKCKAALHPQEESSLEGKC